MDYVEVRGPHPVYMNGFIRVVLRDAKRSITIEEARILAEEALNGKEEGIGSPMDADLRR